LLQGLFRRSISVFAAVTATLGLASAGVLVIPAYATGTADLGVGISGQYTATLGQQVFYNVYYQDYGPDPSTGVVLTNTFSSPVTLNFASGGMVCTQTSPTVISCGPTSVSMNAPGSFHLAVTPSTAGTLVDTLTGTENETDPNPSNNSASWTTTVIQPTTADLSVFKGASTETAYVGQTFYYDISASNAGPANATNVVITDQLPEQVQFVSVDGPCTANGNLLTCQISTIYNHVGIAGIRVTVRAVSAGSAVNTATITADQPDPNLSNNTSSVTVQIQPPTADLAVTKVGTPNPVTAGHQVTYTITVTNNGPSSATGIVTSDSWTATSGIKGGTDFESVSTNQGTCTETGASISCAIGTLAPNSSATVTLVLQPRSKGTLSDTASVAGNEYDPNSANNTATVTTTVG
jgi:uncharacterized repeat protein (TIGR01451 family)